jgi:hypothetical protein
MMYPEATRLTSIRPPESGDLESRDRFVVQSWQDLGKAIAGIEFKLAQDSMTE